MEKNKKIKQVLISSLLLAFFLVALCGCASEADPAQAVAPAGEDPASGETQEGLSGGVPEGAGDTSEALQPGEDGAFHVGSVSELLEAVRPGAQIIIEPGRYDLTEYLSDHPNTRDLDGWNEKHEYVELIRAADGVEILIKGVSGLQIEGGDDDPAQTELVTQPRHASVLNFQGCTDVTLACLTMGHTDGSDCGADVLDFDGCRGIYLRTVDLYGCGVCGIGCRDLSGDLYVSNSTIRDCENGPFKIYRGSGEFTFIACVFAGSGGGGVFEFNDDSQLSFIGCYFGEQESDAWYYFDGPAVFEGCDWEIDDDTGYDWEPPVFDPENMTRMTFGPEDLSDTYWVGYAAVDPQSGGTRYLRDSIEDDADENEYAALKIEDDGSGWLEYRGETMEFECEEIDEQTMCLSTAEQNIYVSLYAGDPAGGSGYTVWLLMQYENELVWFY